MVIFHSYVSLPEGTWNGDDSWHERTPTIRMGLVPEKGVPEYLIRVRNDHFLHAHVHLGC